MRSKWLTEVKFWILSAVFLFLGFGLLTSEMLEAQAGHPEMIHTLDVVAAQTLSHFRSPTLNSTMIDLTALGSTLVLILVCSFVFVVLILKHRRLSATMLVTAALLAAFLSQVFKFYFSRARPPLDSRLVDVAGFSYPSGHSVSSACIYLSLAFIVAKSFESRRHRSFIYAFFSAIIAGVGFSRIFLGVHYFSDVVAGFAVGLACACLIRALQLHLEARGESKFSAL